jgi:hypothetical protein
MPSPSQKPPAHHGAALVLIGGMSLVLVATLEVLGFTGKLDGIVEDWISTTVLNENIKTLPAYVPWLWAVPLVFGLTAGMLGSRMNWRRTVLWVTTLALTLSWIPVLALAGYRATITMPLIAISWCGLWSMVYAIRHQEPEDPPE